MGRNEHGAWNEGGTEMLKLRMLQEYDGEERESPKRHE